MLAVWVEQGNVGLRQVRNLRRRRGEALLRMMAAGVCNTDLELQRGYYKFRGVPGHEFVAEVVEADSPALLGQRVVGEINLPCGQCAWCAQGWGRHCPQRSVLGIVKHPGAFAEYLTLPEANLHVVPASVSTPEAVFTEPLAAACEILDQVKIPAGAPVAVLGDGKLGLLIAQVLHLHGADVRLIGRHRKNLKIAREAGIEGELAGRAEAKRRWEYVVEASGAAGGLRRAVEMVRPRGTVVLKSTVHGLVEIDSAPVVVNEITLVGSRCGRFEPALRLLRSGKLRLAPMIDAEFPLSEAVRAYRKASERGVLKVLLRNQPAS